MNCAEGRSILILGDQLSPKNAAFLSARKGVDRLLFIESRQTFGKLTYHSHRLMLILSAMRHFASERESEGWSVDYHRLADSPDMRSVLEGHCKEHRPTEILVTSPNNHDERLALAMLGKKLSIPLKVIPSTQFLCSEEDFSEFARGKKRLLMENFYREMRRRTGLLLEEGEKPTGGSWNYDAENRSTLRDWKKASSPLPSALQRLKQDEVTKGVAKDIERHFPESPGNPSDFALPVTRKESMTWLDHFIRERLPKFGTWQDLMVQGEPDMFHSMISPMLNIGLLDPLECCLRAEQAFRKGDAPLEAVEGFIRQIIGWREFVNGIYWLKMPAYAEVNGLGATRGLPSFFYNADTDLNCLHQVLGETIRHGFNHHIQRLMILGNFLLLAGINPQEGLRWFNEMYVDAHDWVMAANVLGMALHADGGFMATKPYAGGGSYISKMSNYCEGCSYSPDIKMGPGACPFNLLYWNFYETHQDRFASNPRTAMPVRSWRKRSESERQQITGEASRFLKSLQPHPPG
jgi:deoxyribodipyrimidine photolyase-related protein